MREPSAVRSDRWRGRLTQLRGRARAALPFGAGVLAALGAILLYNLVAPQPHLLTDADVDTSIAEAMASATPLPAYSATAYAAVRPSLVLIQTSARAESGGIGSGVVVDDRGSILTSLHVVDDAAEISITFADGTESPAVIVTAQPEIDIAVLRAVRPPDQLVPAVLGNPNAMAIGDEAFVVGHPLGLYGSLSSGVISGFDRSFRPPDGAETLKGLIQIDAAVNPGNSGGPLINRSGQVVGIVAGLVNPTNQDVFIGLGFAVPITVAGGAAGLPPY